MLQDAWVFGSKFACKTSSGKIIIECETVKNIVCDELSVEVIDH